MIVDGAVYRNGVREPGVAAFDDLFAAGRRFGEADPRVKPGSGSA